jgi:hypothetical protein
MVKSGIWGDLSGVILDWNQHAMIRELLDRNSPRRLSEIKQWEPNRVHDPNSGKARSACA